MNTLEMLMHHLVTTISGEAFSILTVYSSRGISGLGNEALTLVDIEIVGFYIKSP